MNDLATTELYTSPNGRWHLCRASGHVFVVHQANVPSGAEPPSSIFPISWRAAAALSNRLYYG